jgi:hypothetical protein
LQFGRCDQTGEIAPIPPLDCREKITFPAASF